MEYYAMPHRRQAMTAGTRFYISQKLLRSPRWCMNPAACNIIVHAVAFVPSGRSVYNAGIYH
jgi:hypothetical protein